MFNNLNAEQARYGFTDEDVARKLSLTRETYNRKKKNGSFKYVEIVLLCDIFACTFAYLFDETTQRTERK